MNTTPSPSLTRILWGVALSAIFLAGPAAAQFNIYDLGQAVSTHDIRTDNLGGVHVAWTYAGHLYYGRIVNNALTGKVEVVPGGLHTMFWRPYLSVRPDGSTAHIVWNNTGSTGQTLSHSWRDASGWRTESVQTFPSTQWVSQAACAVDGEGVVHAMFAVWNKNTGTNAIYYKRRLASGQWEATQAFTAGVPEHKFPVLVNDSRGYVHATWCIVGSLNGNTFDAFCASAAPGGNLMNSTAYKIPKGPSVSFNSYGDLYVDDNGVMHRAIGGWSNALSKMCIDHSKKNPGGAFSTPTRPSLDFLNLAGGDPVPTVIASENGGVVVAWAEYSAGGAKKVQASIYDPAARRWTIYTVDPAAGFSTAANAYRVALARTSTNVYGIWKGADGHLQLFVMPLAGGSSLSVTSPNGGEEIQAGDTHRITWNAVDLSGTATVSLYKAGAKVTDIGTASVTAEAYSWDIPRATAAGTDYRIRVTQGTNVDESNGDFTILEANAPRIEVSPATLKFAASTLGAHTQDLKVLLTDGKGGQLHWTATESRAWLSISPASGTGDGYLTVSVNPTGLSAGTYTGNISIADADAVNSPQTIAVTLEVQVSTAPAIGAFESPKNGATVKGTVPLTGWALDDIGIATLEIRRDAVRSDLPESIGKDGRVHVGTASFIEGSRPDIETLYPNYPLKNRAGWGFMLDTYTLPGGGNGTFYLRAIATDQEGNVFEIGNRKVLAQNKYNTKPFGLVDAPAWGETIGGTAYANTAWMLTPRPKMIVTSGKTIWVWIDGVKRAHPVYNLSRTDIASRFPTLRNQGGPGGSYTLDTTGYANGNHTIKWVATDSAGASGNTGTSYFRVLNTPSGAVLSASGLAMKTAGSPSAALGPASALDRIPQDYRTPLSVRAGFDDGLGFEPAFPDERGVVRAGCDEDGLVAIRLGTVGPVKGYLVVGGELRPLPVGTTLDATGGIFSWMPGPGFLGTYDLVFVGSTADGIEVKRLVSVRIGSASSAE